MTPVAAPLPRVAPEAAGIASSAVLAFLDTLESNVGGLHSVMLLRHGRVAAEGWWAPYAPGLRHSLFSLSKSFTSTAVGLAVAEGRLTVDDPVVSFFPDRLPQTVSDNLGAMKVRHLLSMSTGHDKDATGPTLAGPDGDWVRAFLALPVEHAPGTKFVYNSTATYMCSAIVQALTGQTVLDYLTPRLFTPLGIIAPAWESCPRGINVGGWGLSIRTEDIARFGQLLLQEGCWDGRQIVPADWIGEATRKQVPNGEGEDSDWTQGYGYQFWRCRHNAYRGDGAFGQFCVVMPEHDVVLAMTGGHSRLQEALDAAWNHLLPGLGPVSDTAPDPALARRLAGLALPVPEGAPASPTAARISGRTYQMDKNDQGIDSASFTLALESGTLVLARESGEQSIAFGMDRWVESHAPGRPASPRLGAPPVGRTAARAAWTDADTLTIPVCYIETPFIETITCRFEGDEIAISRQMNAGFGENEPVRLIGRAARA